MKKEKPRKDLLIGHKLLVRDTDTPEEIEKNMVQVLREIIQASRFYTGYSLEITINSYWRDPKQ